MDAITDIGSILDLRDPHGLAGVALRRVQACHRAVSVLETIGANEILRLQHDAEFTAQMRRALHTQVAMISNARVRVDTHNTLAHVIDTGRVAGLWEHDGIGRMHRHAMSPSRVEHRTMARSSDAERLRNAFARNLPRILASDDPSVLRAAGILSAILYDALLSPALIDALCDPGRHDISGQVSLEQNGDELKLDSDAGQWITMRHRLGLPAATSRWRSRRWRLGTFTQAIFRRAIVCEHARMVKAAEPLNAIEVSGSAGAVEEGRGVLSFEEGLAALDEFLGDNLVRVTRRQVMILARAYWTLRLPNYLFDLASNAAASESLPTDAFERLVHGRRSGEETRPPRTVRHWTSPDRFTVATADTDQRRILRALSALRSTCRNVPKNGFAATYEVRKRVEAWFETHGAVGGWCAVLAHWVYYAVGQERVDERGRALRPSSVLRYLSSYARWLVVLCQDLDPSQVDESVLMGRLDVLSALASQRSSAVVRFVALNEFLVFAERFGSPRIELSDWWSVPSRGGVPRANLITPRECSLVLRRINQIWRGHEASYGCRRMRVMFLLGFWAGLRWSELAWLPHDAIITRGADSNPWVELDVTFSKTFFGTRQLPLHQLLPPDALTEVLQYSDDVNRGWYGSLPDGALLFGEPGNRIAPPSYPDVHRGLQRIMRWVTGDENTVFHDLRHGAASFIALRALMPSSAEWPAYLSSASPSAFKVPAWARTWAGWVSDRPHHDHQRCSTIAALMGHIDARVSLYHYVHVAEFILHAITQQHPPAISDALMSSITGTQVATLKKRRQRELAKKSA